MGILRDFWGFVGGGDFWGILIFGIFGFWDVCGFRVGKVCQKAKFCETLYNFSDDCLHKESILFY